MRSLETRIPPPVAAALMLTLMWLVSAILPQVQVESSVRIVIAGCVALVGATFSIAGAVSFRKARTTVNPLHPEKASKLVTTSVYRITRNPMYLALLLVLLAWAIFLASPLTILGPLTFMAYINRFQICPEEKALAIIFGSEYEQYRFSVRRWL